MNKSYGEGVGYRQWSAPEPREVFLLVHGLGAHAGRWEAMAEFFLKRGISSYAVELRSPGLPGKASAKEDRFGSFCSKIHVLYDIAAKDNPAKKIFLIGESLGAIVSFLVCAGSPGLFSGLICISPAFVPGQKITFPKYVRMLGPLFYNPEKQFTLPFDSSMCTRDPAYRNMMDKDAREYRSISSRFAFEIFLIQARAMAAKKKMMTPTLFLVPEEDRIIDPQRTRIVFESLVVEDKKLISFPGMYHSLSVELDREKVFKDILKWIGDRI